MCVHHWIIAEAKGPTSHGRCCLCHDTRQFSNNLPGDDMFMAPMPIARLGRVVAKAETAQEASRHQDWQKRRAVA